jgi:hypothetical protein
VIASLFLYLQLDLHPKLMQYKTEMNSAHDNLFGTLRPPKFLNSF